MSDIVLIADKNSFGKDVTYQIITQKPVPTNERGLIVSKVYASVRLQPGEILFEPGTYLPVDVIITHDERKILSYLFNYF